MQGLAINVGANTTLPGMRGPIYPDATCCYLPIPERESTSIPPPTYADLSVPVTIPEEYHNLPVHLDPTFAEYSHCHDYTYGDEHGVKAKPISRLSAGDYLFFYATLSTTGTPVYDWIAPEWGVYLIGHFCLAEDPVHGPPKRTLTEAELDRFAHNAHLKREPIDPRILVRGQPQHSRLYSRVIPLSSAQSGAAPGELVVNHTTDSGKGPWWRRPLPIPDPSPFLTWWDCIDAKQ